MWERSAYIRREMVGERRVVVFSLFSFVSANSSLHNPFPPNFLESG